MVHNKHYIYCVISKHLLEQPQGFVDKLLKLVKQFTDVRCEHGANP